MRSEQQIVYRTSTVNLPLLSTFHFLHSPSLLSPLAALRSPSPVLHASLIEQALEELKDIPPDED
jgi:hypothetical protein